MFRNLLRKTSIGLCLASLLTAPTLHAELVFSTPPWGTEQSDRAMFEPIAQAMSKWLRTKVVYQHNTSFTTYSSDMRSGMYDLVLDGAHFTAWRMKNLDHAPLVTLPEKLGFLVLSTDKTVRTLDDLIDKRVCGQAPPHLGTLLVWAKYRVEREPVIQVIQGESQVYDSLKSGNCSTAILRNNVHAKMSEAEKARYKTVFTSRMVPNVGLSAGPKVTEAQRRILIEKMTDPGSAAVFKSFFESKARSATQFEQANSADYSGLDVILESTPW